MTNTILVFHRSKQNAEESLAHQQNFIELSEINGFSPVQIVDYMTGDHRKAKRLLDMIKKMSVKDASEPDKMIVITNSSISEKEYILRYDMSLIFRSYAKVSNIDIYMMDSSGRLYKEVKTIDG